MNLLKYLTLSTALVSCAHAIVLEDILAGKHWKSAKGEEEKVPCQELADSIPAFHKVVETALMDLEEEGNITIVNAGSGPSLMEEADEGEGAASRVDADSLRRTADEEGTDIQEDGVWPSADFENAKINEFIANFFLNEQVAYYLGSFDPVHLGHEAVATHVINRDVIIQTINETVIRDKINYTLICPIWGGDSMKQRTDIKLRLDMLFKAFEEHPSIIVTRLAPYKLQELFTQRMSPYSNDIVVKIPGLKFFGLFGSDIPPTFYEKMQPAIPNFMKGTVISPDRMFNTFGAVDALPVDRYFMALRKGASQKVKEMTEFVGKPVTVFKSRSNVKRMSSSEFKELYKKKLMSTAVSTAEKEAALSDEKEVTLTAETMVRPSVFKFILAHNLYMDRKISSESSADQTQQDGLAIGEEDKTGTMDFTGKVLSIPMVKIEPIMEEESDEDSTQGKEELDDNTSMYQASSSVPTYLPPVKDSLSFKEVVRNFHLSPRRKDTESLKLNSAVISSIDNNNLSPRFLDVTAGSETPFNRVVKGVKKGSATLRRMLSRSRSAGNQSTPDDNKENERPLGKSQSLGSSVGTASKRLRTLSKSQPDQERTTFIPTGDNCKPLVKSQSLGSPLGNPNTTILARPDATLSLASSLSTSQSLELNSAALSIPKKKQQRSLSMSDPSSSHKGKPIQREE